MKKKIKFADVQEMVYSAEKRIVELEDGSRTIDGVEIIDGVAIEFDNENNLFGKIRTVKMVEEVDVADMMSAYEKACQDAKLDKAEYSTCGWMGEGFPFLPNVEFFSTGKTVLFTTPNQLPLMKDVNDHLGLDLGSGHWFVRDIDQVAVWDNEKGVITLLNPEEVF